MFNRIRNFDSKYSSTFFLISLIIIISFLIYISFNNKVRERSCTVPNDVTGNITNYSYKIKYTNNDLSYDIYINRYNSKYLIEKNYNEEKYVYYLNYTDFLEKKSNGSFGKLKDNYIINNVDNNLLILDYINELSLESDVTTINGRTCYVNVKNDLTLCINLDNTIELEKKDYQLLYTIIDKNNVQDFNVYIDLDYNEISNPEENIEE